MTDTTTPVNMQDHWWFRPGWRIGRAFYTWHLTFDGQDDLHRLAAEYRRALKPVGGLDLIPDRWLHLTTQGLGFTDEVELPDMDAIVEAAHATLADVVPFTLEFRRPAIDPEAVFWVVDPAGPNAVRDAIREAIGQVWPEVPERADGFKAHVSIAYSSSDGPAAPIAAALDAVDAAHARAHIHAAQLIVLNRDNKMYEWETYAEVPLGD